MSNRQQLIRIMRKTGGLMALCTCITIVATPQTPTPAGNPEYRKVSSPYHPTRFPRRAELLYTQVWGVDSLTVKSAESGELIRFSYRVVNAERAKLLNDKRLEPSLIDPTARVSLVIPALEKVGKLRNINTPEDGKSYWMAFSNKGRLVKRGDRVTVIIGQFRAAGLVVD